MSCMNIAHRGASFTCAENTAAAARAAAKAGAHAWEFDLRLCADNRPVVIHDEDVVRTSDFSRVFSSQFPSAVNALSLDNLKLLDFGMHSGNAYPDCDSLGPERILTLEDALDLSRESELLANVEIKDCGPADNLVIAQKLVDYVQQKEMLDRVVVSSFNFDVLRFIRRKDSLLHIGVLFDEGEEILPEKWRDIHPISCHVPLKSATSELIGRLRHEGVRIYVYTVDDLRDMKKCLEIGADGMFTNRPERLGILLAGKHPQLV